MVELKIPVQIVLYILNGHIPCQRVNIIAIS